eukprot:TRINITY_DN55412_c0_g1_i1.p1 TRINITY_DN55412_c0_g1~~TRINITY_DN55412_c0_g1_i1.p1  ORF type:complete len:972 (-),score=124.95 TRINITY_DN55412_c0_g1_i1:95-3010(-)
MHLSSGRTPPQKSSKVTLKRDGSAPMVSWAVGAGDGEAPVSMARSASADDWRRKRSSSEDGVPPALPVQARIRFLGNGRARPHGPVLGNHRPDRVNTKSPPRGRQSNPKAFQRHTPVPSADQTEHAKRSLPEQGIRAGEVGHAIPECRANPQAADEGGTRSLAPTEEAMKAWTSTWERRLLECKSASAGEFSPSRKQDLNVPPSQDSVETEGGSPPPRNSPVASCTPSRTDWDDLARSNASARSDVAKAGDSDVQDIVSNVSVPSVSSEAAQTLGRSPGTASVQPRRFSASGQDRLGRFGGSNLSGLGGSSASASRPAAVLTPASRRMQPGHNVVQAEASSPSPLHRGVGSVGGGGAGHRPGQTQNKARNLFTQLRSREEEIVKLRQQLKERTEECAQLRKQAVLSSTGTGARGGCSGGGGGGEVGKSGGSVVVKQSDVFHGGEEERRTRAPRAQVAPMTRRSRTPSPSVSRSAASSVVAASVVSVQRSPSLKRLNSGGRDKSPGTRGTRANSHNAVGLGCGENSQGQPSNIRRNCAFTQRAPAQSDGQRVVGDMAIRHHRPSFTSLPPSSEAIVTAAEAAIVAASEATKAAEDTNSAMQGDATTGTPLGKESSKTYACDISNEILALRREVTRLRMEALAESPTATLSDREIPWQRTQPTMVPRWGCGDAFVADAQHLSDSGSLESRLPESFRNASGAPERLSSCDSVPLDVEVEIAGSARLPHSPTFVETRSVGTVLENFPSGKILNNPRHLDGVVEQERSVTATVDAPLSPPPSVVVVAEKAASLPVAMQTSFSPSRLCFATPMASGLALSGNRSLPSASPVGAGTEVSAPVQTVGATSAVECHWSTPVSAPRLASSPGAGTKVVAKSTSQGRPMMPSPKLPVSPSRTMPGLQTSGASATGKAPHPPVSPTGLSGCVSRHTVHSGQGCWASILVKTGGIPQGVIATEATHPSIGSPVPSRTCQLKCPH